MWQLSDCKSQGPVASSRFANQDRIAEVLRCASMQRCDDRRLDQSKDTAVKSGQGQLGFAATATWSTRPLTGPPPQVIGTQEKPATPARPNVSPIAIPLQRHLSRGRRQGWAATGGMDNHLLIVQLGRPFRAHTRIHAATACACLRQSAPICSPGARLWSLFTALSPVIIIITQSALASPPNCRMWHDRLSICTVLSTDAFWGESNGYRVEWVGHLDGVHSNLPLIML